MKTFILAFALLLSGLTASGQPMLFVVNGHEVAFERMKDYTPSEGDQLQIIRDPEQAVARFGEKACGGVYIMTLPYDTPAVFTASPEPYVNYLYESIEGWDGVYAEASISLVCKISAEGRLSISEVAVSDNDDLLREVKVFIETTPVWEPATKGGKPVESRYQLKILANR